MLKSQNIFAKIDSFRLNLAKNGTLVSTKFGKILQKSNYAELWWSIIATRAPVAANNDAVMEDLNASGRDKHWVGQFQHQNMDEYCFRFSTKFILFTEI